MKPEAETPKDRAVRLSGGVTKLAGALGITRSAVSQWGRVPLDRVFDVERISGVSKEELRPDFFDFPQQETAA